MSKNKRKSAETTHHKGGTPVQSFAGPVMPAGAGVAPSVQRTSSPAGIGTVDDAYPLAQTLASLEPHDWYRVLEQAKDLRRQQQPDDAEDEKEPKPGISKENFASWIARRHLACDPGIREVIYLPEKSPKDTIRLLEINVLSNGPQDEKIEPWDFTPSIPGIDFAVHAADITPAQLAEIRSGADLLPNGWSLAGSQIFGRKYT